jgi:Holliday junction resolvasome RuvABC endonuclease subunit
MKTLGIRVEPKKTTFVVIENCDNELTIINNEIIKVPAALDFPEQLKYIRNCVLDILREYSINTAGIRVAEGNTQNLNITRLYIEGVIQEAFSSSNVENYFTGRKSSIASRLGLKPADIDEALKPKSIFDKLHNWSTLNNSNSKEAALVAMGAIL